MTYHMSLLKNIGEFSYQRMDEIAVQIVHLQHEVQCLQHEVKESHQYIHKLEHRIKGLEKELLDTN